MLTAFGAIAVTFMILISHSSAGVRASYLRCLRLLACSNLRLCRRHLALRRRRGDLGCHRGGALPQAPTMRALASGIGRFEPVASVSWASPQTAA